jgi:hypothetical protein
MLTPLLCLFLAAEPGAEEIMSRMAANVERQVGVRAQYVYHQLVRSTLTRSNGNIARREKREYTAIPTPARTEKKLVSFEGAYSKGGKELIPYAEPGFKYKDTDIDGELIDDLTDDLVNDKDSRDGIPHALFPIRARELPHYRFTYRGESLHKGRRVYKVAFEPVKKKDKSYGITDDDAEQHEMRPWKGEAWVDAEEFQPVRIATDMAYGIPWGVKVFLGINLQQTGFSVTYERVADNVWFPAAYGTEFKVTFFWGYRRTISLSMVSSEFRKTDVSSKIEFETSRN